MNRKQLGWLAVLVVVVGGVCLWLQRGGGSAGGSGEDASGAKLMGTDFVLADVAHVGFKQGTNELNLDQKDESDVWRVRERNGYPANFTQIRDFLLHLAEMKVQHSEEVGPSQLAGLLLTAGQGSDAATVLEIKDRKGKIVKSLLLGKAHIRKPSAAQRSQMGDSEGYPDGRYLMRASDTKTLLLVNDPMSSAEPKADQWLDKTFFKVDRPREVSVAFPDATNSWKISRDAEAAPWKLADVKPDEAVDTNKLTGVSTPFASPSFSDVLTNGAPSADNGLDKPTLIIVSTFDDFTYTVNVGKKNGEDYPLTVAVSADFPKERSVPKDEKPEDKDKADKAWKDHVKQLEDKLKQARVYEHWTYLVPGWNLDSILKSRKDLMVDKKEEAKPEGKTDAAGTMDTKPEETTNTPAAMPATGGGGGN